MNAFYEHHKDSIGFGYRCFDRILLTDLSNPSNNPKEWSGSSTLTGTCTRSVGISCAALLNIFSFG